MITTNDNTALKEAFKDAIREVVLENKELLHDILLEVMEDMAMIHAIEEGQQSLPVEREAIFELLDSPQ
ncbi:MAG: hypothetical protein RBR38_16510 [Desulfomicrobium apsheronum]|jgi:hypothetical protein|nr:hypothetical protein [Desulfomicrobium apsheronum]